MTGRMSACNKSVQPASQTIRHRFTIIHGTLRRKQLVSCCSNDWAVSTIHRLPIRRQFATRRRAIIRECIDLERSVSGGENKVIGDPIDVVLVTRQGAIDP